VTLKRKFQHFIQAHEKDWDALLELARDVNNALQINGKLFHTLIEEAVLEGRVAQVVLYLTILVVKNWHAPIG